MLCLIVRCWWLLFVFVLLSLGVTVLHMCNWCHRRLFGGWRYALCCWCENTPIVGVFVGSECGPIFWFLLMWSGVGVGCSVLRGLFYFLARWLLGLCMHDLTLWVDRVCWCWTYGRRFWTSRCCVSCQYICHHSCCMVSGRWCCAGTLFRQDLSL